MSRSAADILTDPPPAAADVRLAYGPEPLQFGDLRRAEGDGLAVVLHGGSWKAVYNLIHLGHLCVALRDAGIATFNVEYRRVGDPGGGWPGSLEDVLLAGARLRVPVVAVAAVSDPATWANDAAHAFFGGEPPAEGSPLAQAPLGVPQVLVHGTRDDTVPVEQSVRYAETAGDEADLILLEDAGHFEPIDPLSPESATVCAAVERLLIG